MRPLRMLTLALALAAGIAVAAPAEATHGEWAPYDGNPSGILIDSRTGAPVPGVTVNIYDPSGTVLWGTTTSSSDGTYVAPYVDYDEIAVEYDGSAVGYEHGWLGVDARTFDLTVVPTYLDGVTGAPSFYMTVEIDRLRGKPVVRPGGGGRP